jgi:predicted transcriptional regulator of viral defense system
MSPSRAALDPRIQRVLEEHGAIVRASQLLEAGIHPRVLYEGRDSGLERVGHGLYRVSGAPMPAHLDLLIIALRAPNGVVCLISALAFHALTDEIPHAVSVAVPRGAASPRIESPPIRVHHYANSTFHLGLEHHEIERIDVKVYSPARSIVDAFRFRNQIGEDVAIKALAAGLRTRSVRPGSLIELASKLRARAIIEPYLKALQS